MKLRNIITAAAFSVMAAATPGYSLAQSIPSDEPTVDGATPLLTVEKTQIRVQPMLMTDVPLNEPVAIDLGALSVPGVSPTLTKGVTVKAYTRYVEFEGQRIGQLVLTGVEKNGAREALPANAYNAQFNLTEPRLAPGTDVVVEGDAATLIAALERLAGGEPVAEGEEQKEPETVIAQDEPRSQQQNNGSGDSNDLAGAWQAPASVKLAATESVEGVNVTAAGCVVRIDVPQMTAYQQSRTETVKDGVVTDTSECSDDLSNTYPLQKSYAGCQDETIDLDAMTATAQFLLFYTDAGAARQEVSECDNDPEKVFPIVEKACAIFLDYAAFEAVPQVSLIYQNDSNVEVQVRGCAASANDVAVAMTQTMDGCTLRHDFTGDVSYEQAIHIYELGGVQYQAGSCADTEQTYAHTKVYDDLAGNSLCSPIVNLTGGSVTQQSRTQITLTTGGQFISDCSPDASSQGLVATTDGCANPFTWEHDLTAGQSYGQQRFYFLRNGTPDYVTACVQSEAVYAHQVETTDWQDHDDKLFAYERSTVFIRPLTGRYDVVTSEVLQGTVQMPYELTGKEVRETGTVTYEGCDKFLATSDMKLWKRPGGTVYEQAIGPGPRRKVEACATVVTANWPKVRETHRTGSIGSNPRCYGSGKSGVNSERVGSYEGTRTRTREDGEVVVHQTVTKTIKTYGACRGNPPWGPAPRVPNPAGFNQSNIWMTELGWK